MQRHILHLVVASALASGTACRDAAGPHTYIADGAPGVPGTPSTPQPTSPAPYDSVILNFRGARLLAVAGDTLVLSGLVHRGTTESSDALSWATSDASIASIEPIRDNVILLHARQGGSVTITASTRSGTPELSRQIVLRVLPRSNAASPIVVDAFTLVRFSATFDGQPLYWPQVTLRDTSAAGTTRVVGFAIDVPESGSAVFCTADRSVGGGWSAFNAPGDMDYGIVLFPRTARRDGPPTLRVNVLLPDGSAVSSAVTGTMVPLAPGTTWYGGEDTGAQCS